MLACSPGISYLQKDESEGNHFYFIISSPCPKNRVLVVNITSARTPGALISTCFLEPGDHEFIRHRSAVYYQKATIEPCDKIAAGMRVSLLIPKAPLRASVLKRIQEGARQSEDLPIECMDYFQYF